MSFAWRPRRNAVWPCHTSIKSLSAMLPVLVLCLAFLTASRAEAADNEPRVPPGLSSVGAIKVALLGPGIDYRLPELRGHLARDGEGDLIGWDFSDGDNRPFELNSRGTALALAIKQVPANVQFIIVKERPGDPLSFGHMMTFVANTPARIIVWLDGNPKRPDWPILAEAVKRFPDRLFIVPLTATGDRVIDWRAYQKVRVPNVLLVAAAVSVADAKKQSKLVDLSVGFVPNTHFTPDRLFDYLASVACQMAILAGERSPEPGPIELKQFAITARPKGVATQQGYISLQDMAAMARRAR